VLIFRLAWRNLWRNTRRTLITLAAVGLNTAVLITSYALMDGLWKQIVSNATNLVTGEAQIHAPEYLVHRSIYNSLENPKKIMTALENQGIGAAARSYDYGLLAHESKSAGAQFWGVDPNREREVFGLADNMFQGRFLPEQPQHGIVLGKKLARSLNVSVGSEIVVVVQAADGSLGNDLYTVTGILKTVGESIDRNAAILHQADFQTLFVSEGRIHEIALNARGRLPLEDLAQAAVRAGPEAEVKTWRQLMPALSDIVNLLDVTIWIFLLIFFLAAGLGVMNTMLMATFERIREFGIIKALGAGPWRILGDVAVEALWLGLVASALGALLGLAGAYYLQEIGLDTSAFAADYTVAGVAFDPLWRADLTLKAAGVPVIVMWLVCVLASLYPAFMAARLDPVRAIQHV